MTPKRERADGKGFWGRLFRGDLSRREEAAMMVACVLDGAGLVALLAIVLLALVLP